MNKTIIVSLCMGLAALSANAQNTITMQLAPSQYSDGGGFSAVTSGNGNFITYCVNSTTGFYTGQQYDYVLAQSDYLGNPLSEGAAYLFTDFSKGTITINNQASSEAFQEAIWTLQNQSIPVGFTTANAGDNADYALAQNALGSNLEKANDGTYPVAIMQLTDNGVPAQNQLVYDPDITPDVAPEPSQFIAGSMMLGFGLVGYFSRRVFGSNPKK